MNVFIHDNPGWIDINDWAKCVGVSPLEILKLGLFGLLRIEERKEGFYLPLGECEKFLYFFWNEWKSMNLLSLGPELPFDRSSGESIGLKDGHDRDNTQECV